jgi:hypothetical protein
LAKPEMFIGLASGKFKGGVCVDDVTRKVARDQMIALERWTLT